MAGAISKPVQRDIWKDAMQSRSSFNIVIMGGTSIFTADSPCKNYLFKVQNRIYFSTHFIVSNVYGGLTSKLQATNSINNVLINGSKTLAKYIKTITFNRDESIAGQCDRLTKVPKHKVSPMINRNNQLPFLLKITLQEG